MRIPAAINLCRPLIALLALATAHAGDALVDMDAFNQERALWEGTAVTNKITAKEIERLQSEIARLEPMEQANADLRTRIQDLDEIANGIISNNFIEWHTGDGKMFIAKLAGDDGKYADMNLRDGRTGRVDRVKLADADIELLNLLKAWHEGP